ncbi:MAG: methyltransferase family protein [Betaproteobacteria bacterium]
MTRIVAFLGGALFVASLVFCAWSYLVVWGTPDPATFVVLAGRPLTGAAAAAADVVLFALFALHHSLFAREPTKRALARALPDSMVRPLYVWTASLLLIAVCAAWVPIGGALYRHRGPWAGLHAAVQLAGLWLTAAAVRLIDPFELAGIHDTSALQELQIAGPYRWVRHPIYLGWALMVFGSAHMTGDRLAFAVLSTAYLIVAIPWEERGLVRAFGGSYRAYQQRVRWRMIPYVY